MRPLSRLSKLLFVLSLPLLFISIGVYLVSTSGWFYERGFDTYGVVQTTGIERSELVKAGNSLIAYFKSDSGATVAIEVMREGQKVTLFNEREVVHLADVKELFKLSFRIGEMAGLYLVAYTLVVVALKRRIDLKDMASLVMQGSILTLTILIGLGIGSLIDFQKLFVQFHVISFRNDLWMLDPSTDYLIMMFPGGFWVDATLAVALVTALLGIVSGGVAYVYLRERRRNMAARMGMAPH